MKFTTYFIFFQKSITNREIKSKNAYKNLKYFSSNKILKCLNYNNSKRYPLYNEHMSDGRKEQYDDYGWLANLASHKSFFF